MSLARRSATWLILALILAAAYPLQALQQLSVQPGLPAAPQAAPVTDQNRPSDIPLPAQYRYSADAGADNAAYHFDSTGRATTGRLLAEVVPAGALLRLGEAAFTIGPVAFGRGTTTALPAAGETTVTANRLDRERGPLAEWFVNGPLGFQQAWTVAEKPAGAGALQLDLGLDGGTAALAGPREVTLTSPDGSSVPYGGLYAYDATGRELPAQFDVASTGGAIRVTVDDAGAVYPVVIDPYVLVQFLTSGASNAEGMGLSVALSADGGVAVFTAPFAQEGGVDTSAAYVYNRPAQGWGASGPPSAKLIPGPGAASTNGDVLAISADGSTIAAGEKGSLFVNVYVRPPGGWSGVLPRTATLSTPDATPGPDGFPQSIAISANGSVIAVGDTNAFGENPGDGAVYIFNRPGPTWTNRFIHDAKLTVGEALFSSPDLGASLAMNGDASVLVAGAPNDVFPGPLTSGSAYVYLRSGPTWVTMTQSAKLTSNSPSSGARLGAAVALSADSKTIAAGGCWNSNSQCPFADVFVTASTWTTTTSTALLQVGGSAQGFGRWLAMTADGGRIIVSGTSFQRRAFVYERPPSGWAFTMPSFEFVEPVGGVAQFGGTVTPLAVSANGDTLISGDPSFQVNPVPDSPAFVNAGAGIVFLRPRITGFSPTSGSPGDIITITGEQLQVAGPVRFGATNALSSTVVSTTTVKARVGEGSTGTIAMGSGSETIFSDGVFTFNRGPSTTTISNTVPSPSAPGQSVTVNYNVSTALGKPNGTVNVTASTGESCSGQATGSSCSMTFNSVGTRVLTATFEQTAAHSGSVSSPVNHNVSRTATTITLSNTTPNPSRPENSVRVNYVVSSTLGAPNGTVTVTASTGEDCFGSGTDTSCFLFFDTPGTRTLTAAFGQTDAFSGSVSSPIIHNVNRTATTATIGTSTPNPSATDRFVDVSYAISSTLGAPNGTVTVTASTGEFCRGDGTDTSCSIEFETPGTRTLSATFGQTNEFSGSVSSSITHQVKAATFTNAFADGDEPFPTGKPLTFFYNVSSNFGIPTGTVSITASTGEFCTGPAPNGFCQITFATAASRVVTATYGGSATFFPSSDNLGILDVGVPTFTTITGFSPIAPTANQTVTVSFSVTSTSGTPVGTVEIFSDEGSCITTVAAGGCQLVFTTPGQRTVTAVYNGGNGFAFSLGTRTLSVFGPPEIGAVDFQVFPTSASLKFNLFPNGTQTNVFVDYWLVELPSNLRVAQQITQTIAGPEVPAGQFSLTRVEMVLGPLERNATYAFQIRLVTPAGTIIRPPQQFTTGAARYFAPFTSVNSAPEAVIRQRP